MSYDRMSAALDRHITGNYGEDQFAGEEAWEALCDKAYSLCIFHKECPFESQCSEECAVVKAVIKDEEDEQMRLDDEMYKAWLADRTEEEREWLRTHDPEDLCQLEDIGD